ncbi:hypothetical protein ACUTAF_02140 [Pseudomonas sp. SP16.1]|uniref:hypothetical protein n=1 Tax=Pseudomonas sp. SP16.1 TaxID=3458854 RepID=UPI004045F5C1
MEKNEHVKRDPKVLVMHFRKMADRFESGALVPIELQVGLGHDGESCGRYDSLDGVRFMKIVYGES